MFFVSLQPLSILKALLDKGAIYISDEHLILLGMKLILHALSIFWFTMSLTQLFCIHSFIESKPLGQQTLLDEINKDFIKSCYNCNITSVQFIHFHLCRIGVFKKLTNLMIPCLTSSTMAQLRIPSITAVLISAAFSFMHTELQTEKGNLLKIRNCLIAAYLPNEELRAKRSVFP